MFKVEGLQRYAHRYIRLVINVAYLLWPIIKSFELKLSHGGTVIGLH